MVHIESGGSPEVSRHAKNKKLRSELSIIVSPPEARDSVATELKRTLSMISSQDVEWTGIGSGSGTGELVVYLEAVGRGYGEAQDALDDFVAEMVSRMDSTQGEFEQGSNLLLPA